MFHVFKLFLRNVLLFNGVIFFQQREEFPYQIKMPTQTTDNDDIRVKIIYNG